MVAGADFEDAQRQALAAAMAEGLVAKGSEPRYPQAPHVSKVLSSPTEIAAKSGHDEWIHRNRSLHSLFSTSPL